MPSLHWSSSGVGVLSVAVGFLTYLVFRKKVFGLLDPMSFFIVTRLAPLISVLILMMSERALHSYYFLLLLASAFLFISALWLSARRVVACRVNCEVGVVRGLLKVAVGLFFLKIFIFIFSTGTLPVFGESGSDSFIRFDVENKISSSLLLGISRTDIVLLSFVIPLARGKMRFASIIFLILALLLVLVGGKKSAILGSIVSVGLGEYLRINFINGQCRYFIRPVMLLMFGLAAVGWAAWVYSRGPSSYEDIGQISIVFLLDLVFLQWAYPFFLFASGELSSFFDVYQVHRPLYFFHSISSPLGFPAFHASIGPALHEFKTGNLSGNGTNPTFVLEGYVLFGILMPLYACVLGLFIGLVRTQILSIKSLRRKVLYSSIFLSSLFVIPVSSLLFMKMLWVIILLSPMIHILMRLTTKCLKHKS